MKNLKEKGYFAERLYQLRYLVAAVILLCSVLFEISGSSIGFWSVLLDGTYESSAQDTSGDLLGPSRRIRTDEWAVSTPLACSQEYQGRQYGCIYCIRAAGKVMGGHFPPVPNRLSFSGTFAGAGIFLVCPDAGAVFGISGIWNVFDKKEKTTVFDICAVSVLFSGCCLVVCN